MAAIARVPLLDVGLELTQHLTPDERAELAGIDLPVVLTEPGPLGLDSLLKRHQAFSAIVLDGIVMNSLRIGEQTGIQLLGPGDVLVPPGALSPSWLANSDLVCATEVRLVLFANDLFAGVNRCPGIVQALYGCIGDQLQRLTAQLVICQIPRVDERVLAMLWLLAESWGVVTPSGVRLPIALTHETLGALVGARRPTITLALRKLVQEDAIVHQDSGWLLLEPPPSPTEPAEPRILPPALSTGVAGRWAQAVAQAEDPGVNFAELRDTVRRLREQHQSDRQRTHERLMEMQRARARLMAMRQRLEEDASKRRPRPAE